MPSKANLEKAQQLLMEGRLDIVRVDIGGRDHGYVVARCRGLSGSTHDLGFDPYARNGRGEWRCTCEANKEFHRECSHLVALRLVVSR
jgi:hypothetical protein